MTTPNVTNLGHMTTNSSTVSTISAGVDTSKPVGKQGTLTLRAYDDTGTTSQSMTFTTDRLEFSTPISIGPVGPALLPTDVMTKSDTAAAISTSLGGGTLPSSGPPRGAILRSNDTAASGWQRGGTTDILLGEGTAALANSSVNGAVIIMPDSTVPRDATTTATNVVTIGKEAGKTAQDTGSVAIGYRAGMWNQDINCVAIGHEAGAGNVTAGNNQTDGSVAVGKSAGSIKQSAGSIAIGKNAGNNQDVDSIAIGRNSASFGTQGAQAISIGGATNSSTSSQGAKAVSVGYEASILGQGDESIALGYRASATSTQPANSFYIGTTCIRTGIIPGVSRGLFYDSSTGEIYHDVNNSSTTLQGLTDTSIVGQVEGDNLVWNATTNVWEPRTQAPSVTNINDLSDVNTTGITNDQYLKYDGSGFVPATLPAQASVSMNDITDVNTTGITNDQYLKYDGSGFIPATLPAQASVSMNDITDVNTTGITNDQYLKYDGSGFVPASLPAAPVVPTNIEDLSNVDTTGITNDQYLKYDGSGFVPATLPAQASVSMNDITDVVITTAGVNNYLRYDGSNWVNTAFPIIPTLANFSFLTDKIQKDGSDVLDFTVNGVRLTGNSYEVGATKYSSSQVNTTANTGLTFINDLSTKHLEVGVGGSNVSSYGTLSIKNVAGVDNTIFNDDGTISGLPVSKLSDTVLTSPALNEVLTYNGSQWINQAPSSGPSLANFSFVNNIIQKDGSTAIDFSSGNLVIPTGGFRSSSGALYGQSNITQISGMDFIDTNTNTLLKIGDAGINGGVNVSTYGTLTLKNSAGGDLTIFNNDGTISGLPVSKLSDTVLTSPATNDVLTFDGTNWINQQPSGGGGGASPNQITYKERTVKAQQGLVDSTIKPRGDPTLLTKKTIPFSGSQNKVIAYDDTILCYTGVNLYRAHSSQPEIWTLVSNTITHQIGQTNSYFHAENGIYVYGSTASKNSIYYFDYNDPVNVQLVGTAPTDIYRSGLVIYDNKIWLIGGESGVPLTTLYSAPIEDPLTLTLEGNMTSSGQSLAQYDSIMRIGDIVYVFTYTKLGSGSVETNRMFYAPVSNLLSGWLNTNYYWGGNGHMIYFDGKVYHTVQNGTSIESIDIATFQTYPGSLTALPLTDGSSYFVNGQLPFFPYIFICNGGIVQLDAGGGSTIGIPDRSCTLLGDGAGSGSGGTSSSNTNITMDKNNSALGKDAFSNISRNSFVNSTAIGTGALPGASNEIRLGKTGTSVVLGDATIVTSDLRDKSDILDTDLGLEFIDALQPKKYKLESRLSYVEKNYEDTGTWIDINDVVRDGSLKKTRNHYGLISQEVATTLTALGVDPALSGMYIDNNAVSGRDELALRYEEFICPLIKAVQELSARLTLLEAASV